MMEHPPKITSGYYPIYEKTSDGRWISAFVINDDRSVWINVQDLTSRKWADCRANATFDAEWRLHNEHGPAVWIPDA